jgi:flagellar biosynthesis/type III secretory pathway protein FliH
MVIGALEAVQGMVKKATQDSEEKLMTLTVQVVEEILEKESEVKKEVATTRETLQKFMEAWKGVMQQD